MTNNLVIKTENCILDLRNYEIKLLDIFSDHWLPTDNILVSVDERSRFFHNIWYSLNILDEQRKSKAIYISKFLAAVSSWLFDAALNYLWNETINDLREKVKWYNIKYFYDTLSIWESRRKDLNNEDDLVKLTDDELIRWCKNIELISEMWFRELDNIRYMRNWASAAHPNNANLSAIQLLHYFEICLKEVISIETPKIAVEINKLLWDLKSKDIDQITIKSSIEYLKDLPELQKENLINWLFWIYTNEKTTQTWYDNIVKFLKDFSDFIPDTIKSDLWLRYAWFKINNFEFEEKKSRDFLKIINGESFIPINLKIIEIQDSLENLLNSHNSSNNYYSEPIFAKQLRSIVGDFWSIPNQISHVYVYTLVEVFLTNWNWYAWNADPIYYDLIKKFDKSLSLIALTSYSHDWISSKLRYNKCKMRFLELLDIIKDKIVDDSVKDFIEDIKKEKDLDKLKSNDKFRKKIKDLKILLK